MPKTIPLTQGQFATVDDGDYESLSGYRWCARKHGKGFVAIRAYRKHQDRKAGHVYMHRAVLNAAPAISVRHWDGNGLHNVRANLYTVPRQSRPRRANSKNPRREKLPAKGRTPA